MTVRAFDLGTPSLYSDVNVRVFILDQNDHAPKVSSFLCKICAGTVIFPFSFKHTSTGWTFQRIPQEAPLFCRWLQ